MKSWKKNYGNIESTCAWRHCFLLIGICSVQIEKIGTMTNRVTTETWKLFSQKSSLCETLTPLMLWGYSSRPKANGFLRKPWITRRSTRHRWKKCYLSSFISGIWLNGWSGYWAKETLTETLPLKKKLINTITIKVIWNTESIIVGSGYCKFSAGMLRLVILWI